MLDRATIKADYLSVIIDDFMCAAEELPECHFGSYVHITDSLWFWLIHSAESSSENAAFNLDASVVTDVEEGVLLQKELVKDFVAVPLVAVASSFN